MFRLPQLIELLKLILKNILTQTPTNNKIQSALFKRNTPAHYFHLQKPVS